MIESDGKVYIYSTGGGGVASPDGLAWATVPTPSWNRSLANNQGIWAPDGIFLNGQYYLYGSMWSSAKDSALVLLTTPSLNPGSPNYKWTDQGVAIAGPVGVTHSVIDPAPIVDAAGNLWVSWGGGYPFPSTANSIFVTRMDNKTGLPLTTDPGWQPPDSPGYPIAQGHREGSYIHYHGGYYYFFWQTGGCCSGASSTYTINVSRSQSITGPYSGDQVFYAGTATIHGPGHIGVYSSCGVERFTYHYYPNAGGSLIGENELQWSASGWPVVGPESTTPLKLCGAPGGTNTDGGIAWSGDAGTGATGGADASTNHAGDSGTGAGLPGDMDAPSGTATSSGGLPGTGGSSGSRAVVGPDAGAWSDSATGGGASDGSGFAGQPAGSPEGHGGCAISERGSVFNGSRGLWLLGAALAIFARRRARLEGDSRSRRLVSLPCRWRLGFRRCATRPRLLRLLLLVHPALPPSPRLVVHPHRNALEPECFP
ncbi:MAG: family 43 glycosylhydrolase [Myxococcota bacterium]|nr:family 43 glycosylhydrolase [Myxococcota bacterium]